MSPATRHSRWSPKKRNIIFHEGDLNICKLLTPYAHVRAPWGYTYLPTPYFAPLLNRGPESLGVRLTELVGSGYLSLPDQPKNNYRPLIYQLGKLGAAEVRECGFHFTVEPRALSHELGCCLIAADFELGSVKYNLPIKLLDLPEDLKKRPDWPVFTFCGRAVFVEFDTGSESLKVIEGKYEAYLDAIARGKLRKPMFLFVTTKADRVANMVERLKQTIDKHGYPYDYAEHFGFAHMEYDRFLYKIPKPSCWPVTRPWIRAGFEPFVFHQPKGASNGRTTEAHQGTHH